MHIQLDTSPADDDLSVISQGIKAFNRNHLSDDMALEDDTRFAVFAKDEHGAVVGGIRAVAFWNYCSIELLWLAEEARGHGTGTRLIERAEAYAREKGFEYIRTETLSFQAKPFYEKMGYTVYGELADYPVGHTTYCLVKSLAG